MSTLANKIQLWSVSLILVWLVSGAQATPVASATPSVQAQLTTAEQEFALAASLMRIGQPAQAQQILQGILHQNPEFDKVRYLLVQSLAMQGKYAPARRHLAWLMRPGTDPEVLAAYRALDHRIAQVKPWRYAFSFGLRPTDNINRATDKQVVELFGLPFVIDNATKAKRGVRRNLQIGAERRFVLGPKSAATLGGFLSYVGTGDHTQDNVELGLTGAYSTAFSNTLTFRANMSYLRNFIGQLPSHDRRSISVSLQFPLTTRLQQEITLGHSHIDYVNPTIRDGASRYVSTLFRFRTSDRQSIRFGTVISQSRALRLRDQYDGRSLSLGMTQRIGKSLILNATAVRGKRDFIGVNPLTRQKQQDLYHIIESDVTFSNLQLWGFSPQVGLRFEKVNSSFHAKSFDTLGASFTLTRQF